MNILFVCTGNTCRSPMAEAIFRHIYPTMNVQSAGIYANTSSRENPHTKRVLQTKNIDINHTSQPVTEELLDWAQYVFVMTKSHKYALEMQYPQYRNKYFLLKQFVLDPNEEIEQKLQDAYEKVEQKKKRFDKENGHLEQALYEEALEKHLQKDLITISELKDKLNDTDVSDPFGGTVEVYEQTYDELDRLIRQLNNLIN